MPHGYLIAEEQYLGTIKYASQAASSWGWPSRAYFCASCGEIWARLVLLDSTDQPLYFRTANVSCRRHPDPWNIPGSLLYDEIAYNLNELSLEALRRELDVHLAYYERQL